MCTLSALPGENDIETFRTPQEYLAWFDALLQMTHESSKLRSAALLHKGFFKRFYEEIFPLAMLLTHKRDDWKNTRFCNRCDSDSYDVEVESQLLSFKWIEITCTTFDADEHFRMQHLLQHGYVTATGEMLRNERGTPIGIVKEARRRDLAIEAECTKVRERIAQKASRRYGSKPALLVYFDDSTSVFQKADYSAVEAACRCAKSAWRQSFARLFAIGARNERLIDLQP